MRQTTRTKTQESYVAPRANAGLLMKLYSVIWWTFFAVTIVFFTAMVFLLSPLILVDKRRNYMHLVASAWGWTIYALNPFWTLRIEGRKNLPWIKRAVIVANHDSLADILVVSAIFKPFKFVSKESIFKVPFLGWGMSLVKDIPLKRGDRASIIEMLNQCRYWLEQETPIMMFPEGTRSKDGVVRPFKNGAFQIAIDTDSPVIPVVLAGTADALPKHGWVAPLESHVRVKILEPVYPSEFQGNLDALREHVHTIIVAEKAQQTELLRKSRF